MTNHFLKVTHWDNSFHIEFECKANPTAFCRCRPDNPDAETWTIDEAVSSGHTCFYQDWVDGLGLDEAFAYDDSLPENLTEIPIDLVFDEQPVIDNINMNQYGDLAQKVQDEIYNQLSGHYGDFSTPSPTTTRAILQVIGRHFLSQLKNLKTISDVEDMISKECSI